MSKKVDIAVLIILTFVASAIALLLRVNFFTSTLLVFGAPALYLSLKNPKSIRKVSIFSLLISVPFSFFVDYMITRDNGWLIISSLFSYRVFGIVALEQFIWGF